jgi:hypothetical protein
VKRLVLLFGALGAAMAIMNPGVPDLLLAAMSAALVLASGVALLNAAKLAEATRGE